jgi:hypothetical protein
MSILHIIRVDKRVIKGRFNSILIHVDAYDNKRCRPIAVILVPVLHKIEDFAAAFVPLSPGDSLPEWWLFTHHRRQQVHEEKPQHEQGHAQQQTQ